MEKASGSRTQSLKSLNGRNSLDKLKFEGLYENKQRNLNSSANKLHMGEVMPTNLKGVTFWFSELWLRFVINMF